MERTTAATTVLGVVTALALVGAPQASAAAARAAGTAAAEAAPDLRQKTACYQATRDLWVREEPRKDAKAVGLLKKGQVVRASVKETNGFRELGPQRWSSARYLIKVTHDKC
ncbi:hypothetical protein [Saccharothrix australiensis]|uniref:SH3 domain-containing protein n=1 Tax=Saccharothrix australiensis TaxID=2072 RepID=A0A495W0J1_9PSEU|nr:hypothetical protein [Saccharothrix australiensis]RKT54527.1 hypothetical protein C8E97_3170 [Saccharothrix australiensis]